MVHLVLPSSDFGRQGAAKLPAEDFDVTAQNLSAPAGEQPAPSVPAAA